MKFAELSAPKLNAVDRENTLVILPIAATEQHGPHLPTGTDTFICTAIAEELERRHSESILLLPTYWLGASAHHLRFGATLTAELNTYIKTLYQIAGPLLKDGHRRLMLLNGHGGNNDPLRIALRQLQLEHPASLLAGAPYWADSEALLNSILEGTHKFVGHACEFETSMMLHLRPELVDTARVRNAGELVPDTLNGFHIARDMRQRTRDGCTGRPDLASAEKGSKLFSAIVEQMSHTVRVLLAEPLPC